MSLSSNSTKKNLRSQILAVRSALSDELIASSSSDICAIMQEKWRALFARFQQAFLFYPLPKEPDLRALATFLRTQGVITALPVTQANSMAFKAWHADDQLQCGRFNIKEPRQGSVCHPNAQTVVFVPCLALDRQGFRLGYGRGYYDRFLADNIANKPTTVGVCLHRFLQQSLPHEKHDQTVDYLLTDEGLVHK